MYLPCAGSRDRDFEYQDVLNNLIIWLQKYSDYDVIIGGDFNTDVDKPSSITSLLLDFVRDNGLCRSDTKCINNIGNAQHLSTYFNDALGAESNIDYFLSVTT